MIRFKQTQRHSTLCLLLVTLMASMLVSSSMGAEPIRYKTVKDIAYYPPEKEGVDRCRLDVYYPTNIPDFASVLWFHAGGLKVGNRYIPGVLRNQGFAIVPVDYRLSPNVKAPAYIEDAAAAVAWTVKNIETYGGSPDRIILAGASAGGYLITMIGLDKTWLGKHGVDANQLAGLASLSGQAITHATVRGEKKVSSKRPIIDKLAPLYHVRPDAPPILLVTGDRELELLGRYEENAYFMRMLKLVGHPDVELIELPGNDHKALERAAYPDLLKFLHRILDSQTKETS